MERREEFEQLKKEYQDIKIPQQGLERIEKAVFMAKKKKRRQKRLTWALSAAAMALVVLPNVNPRAAYAMGNLPVIGGLFKVITVREYNYEDEHNVADIQVPQISAESQASGGAENGIAQVNKSVDEYAAQLEEQFKASMTEQGYNEMTVSYKVVTDTKEWFTLKMEGTAVAASGYEFSRYYNVDKMTGQVIELKDLFKAGADYVTPISQEIKKQMKEQMDAQTAFYFLDDEEMTDAFKQIQEDQNFYLKEDGSLVIAFDEYEVGPGYIGAPEFVIPQEVVGEIRK